MKHPAIVQIERVFSAKIRGGKIRFREECDRYFEAFLTADEVRVLASQLEDLADELDVIGRLSPPGQYE